MRLKYKPKPKIPVGSAARERETTPSVETGKETLTGGPATTNITTTATTAATTTTSSPGTNSVTVTKQARTSLLNFASQESPGEPVSTTSCTSSNVVSNTTCTLTCSTGTTGLTCNSSSTGDTSLTSLDGSLVTSSARNCSDESGFENSHSTIRTSSCDDLVNNNLTISTTTADSSRHNTDYCNVISNNRVHRSPSFNEGLPGGIQAESVTICEDDTNLNGENCTTVNDIIFQPSSHQYPSFIESLSSSVLREVTSSHRALGLEQPADDEVVYTSSAIETTYKRRCYEEESDVVDEEMEVFDSCTDDHHLTTDSFPQPQVCMCCIYWIHYV